MTQGERIKLVRKELNLTLEKFGERIGLKKSSLSQVENGINSVTEQLIKSICREFNVDYLWLTTGEGEMFNNLPETVLDELALQYGLTDEEKELTKEFLNLSKEDREALMRFFRPQK